MRRMPSSKSVAVCPNLPGALGLGLALACGGDNRGASDAFGTSSTGMPAGSGTQGEPSGSGTAGPAGTQGSTDGESDGNESTTGSIPSDDSGDGVRFDLDPDGPTPGDTPGEHRTCGEGEFLFVVPYQLPPDPSRGTIDCSGGSVTQADVVLNLDTSNSMQSMIDGVRASFGQIVHDLAAEIPNIAFGVGGFEDFPGCAQAGAPGDIPWYLVHRVMTVSTPAGIASIEAELGKLYADQGGDGPESSYQALHEIATGEGIQEGGANVPAFNPATAPPMVPPAGETVGDIGGVGFRPGSLPITILATDTSGHNCESWPENNYTCGMAGASTCNQAIQEMVAIGGRVIAMVPGLPFGIPPSLIPAAEVELAKVYDEIKYTVIGTGGVVPASAWSIGGAPRPAGCAPDQCCTLENGAGRAPEPSGECPLVFRLGGEWMGVGDSVATAIKVLARGGSFDIGAQIQDDPSDGVDAVAAFVDHVETSGSNTAPCTTGHMTQDSNGDGHDDRFLNLTTGQSVCFDLIPKKNLTVPATSDEQRFKAYLDIQASGITSVGRIEVTFIVPPAITPE